MIASPQRSTPDQPTINSTDRFKLVTREPPHGQRPLTRQKFIFRTEWEFAFAEVIEQHLGHACAKFDNEPEEIFDLLGELAGNVLHGCALEDFMAPDYEGGRNVVDEYLKRRGYTESRYQALYEPIATFRHEPLRGQ
jgi:hypothetical protein